MPEDKHPDPVPASLEQKPNPAGAAPNAGLVFAREAYDMADPALMGRRAAGHGFLRAVVAHGGYVTLYPMLSGAQQGPAFESLVGSMGWTGAITPLSGALDPALAALGMVYYPSPVATDLALARLRVGQRAFSICGVTHTTASHAVMEQVTSLPVLPFRAWDAMICTSRAVRDTVRVLLDEQLDYLRWRLGASRFDLPQMPVIPLGVHAADYAIDAEERAQARAALGIDDDEIVVLFVGRLSFHAKAHPLPMYQAAAEAAQRTGKRFRIVEAGWFANTGIETAFQELAGEVAPGVRVDRVDGRVPDQRDRAWASADIFCSLSDNYQETFGLTPIEAMAAGLPAVVSDWNGYKDTVRDGIDGFRITTIAQPEASLDGLAAGFETGQVSYDYYCGLASQMTAVDIAETASAFTALCAPDLRRRMGEAGRARVAEHFTWARVIAAYQALWRDLGERRRADPDPHGPAPRPWAPSRGDPSTLFATYPTRRLHPDDILALTAADLATALALFDRRSALQSFAFSNRGFAKPDTARGILRGLASAPGLRAPLGALVSQIPAAHHGMVTQHVLWLCKMGVLRVANPRSGDQEGTE